MRFIMRDNSDPQLSDTTIGKAYNCKILKRGDLDHEGIPVYQDCIAFVDDAKENVYYWESYPSGSLEIQI